jgi:hypothetical protein
VFNQVVQSFLSLLETAEQQLVQSIDHAKQEGKKNDVTVSADEATTPPTNKNDKTRERCDKEGSTCRSVGGED